MSSSFGRALQRSKRTEVQQVRRRYRDALDQERHIALNAEEQQRQRSEQAATGLQSIWATNDLDNFLAIADARAEGYFAERDVRVVIDGMAHVVQNDKIVPEQMTQEHHDWLKLSEMLTVPRRPEWNYTMSPDAVQLAERTSFLDWRRSLAKLEEEQKVLLTPFERNLEVWRQLWRVVERADVIAVIVDARNPLIFRSKDFEDYARSHRNSRGEPKQVLLLLNKADLLSEAQRRSWAAYFEDRGDAFFFFSARPLESGAATAAMASGTSAEKDDEEDSHSQSNSSGSSNNGSSGAVEAPLTAPEQAALQKVMRHKKEKTRHRKKTLRAPVEVANPYELAAKRQAQKQLAHLPKEKVVKPPTAEETARDARVATSKPVAPWAVLDPVQLLDQLASLRSGAGVVDDNVPLMVGLVGYPNVGKSSTINAIIGCKKVVVSATPGKTKHFQTLTIPEERRVALCDCPGLVFPSFASTTAQMVCDGILPIDTATDAMQATAIICKRIPRQLLEAELILSLSAEDDVDESHSLAERLLNAMARRRGYMASHDRPNKSRAGKDLLKLYVDGHFVYAEPPPSYRPTPAELSVDAYLSQHRGDGAAALAAVVEEWDSDAEEAWADLDSADDARALSDDDEHSLNVGEAAVALPMFYDRPRGHRHSFTRYEIFNAEGNEARMARHQGLDRRRKKKTNHQLEPDLYTFVNRAGEVELRIDDDDGVLELVTATGGPVLPATKAKIKSKRQVRRETKHGGSGGDPMTRRTQRAGL